MSERELRLNYVAGMKIAEASGNAPPAQSAKARKQIEKETQKGLAKQARRLVEKRAQDAARPQHADLQRGSKSRSPSLGAAVARQLSKQELRAANIQKVKAFKKASGPKFARNSYMIFVQEQRPKLIAEQPEMARSVKELGKALGGHWRALSTSEKQPYNERAAVEKARYEREYAAFEPQLKEFIAGLEGGELLAGASSKVKDNDDDSRMAELKKPVLSSSFADVDYLSDDFEEL